ncbi:MAG: energy-coupling factor transport system permease protein [Cellvibrionaceae bacterium]|jgi:energy-coupling factor transport system permease protein
MSVSVNLFIPGKSWLHTTDPRIKLLFVAAMLFLLILFKNVWVMAAACALLHLLHTSAGTPFAKIKFLWCTLLPVGLLMLVLRMLFYPAGTILFEFSVVQITTNGLAEGFVLAFRILTMALTVFAWLYTTTQPDLVQSFVRLGMPHEWGLTLSLALRYIPTFQGTFSLISEAQQARGLDLKRSKGFQRVQQMMPIFVAMIISSLRSSEQLAMALESRGYGRKGVARSTLYPLKFSRRDYVLAVGLFCLFAICLWVYFFLGFGADPIQLLASL